MLSCWHNTGMKIAICDYCRKSESPTLVGYVFFLCSVRTKSRRMHFIVYINISSQDECISLFILTYQNLIMLFSMSKINWIIDNIDQFVAQNRRTMEEPKEVLTLKCLLHKFSRSNQSRTKPRPSYVLLSLWNKTIFWRDIRVKHSKKLRQF